jgi:hypothetical protein
MHASLDVQADKVPKRESRRPPTEAVAAGGQAFQVAAAQRRGVRLGFREQMAILEFKQYPPGESYTQVALQ